MGRNQKVEELTATANSGIGSGYTYFGCCHAALGGLMEVSREMDFIGDKGMKRAEKWIKCERTRGVMEGSSGGFRLLEGFGEEAREDGRAAVMEREERRLIWA